jgi:hypothetical protein
MNHVIAYELLTAELNVYRDLAHEDLRQLVGECTPRMVRGKDGVDYDVATTVKPSLGRDGCICVRAFIGEAAWGAPYDSVAEMITVSPKGPPVGASLA